MKVCVGMWYNEEIKEYADKFRDINKKWCEDRGYNFFCGDKVYVITMP